MYSVKFSQCTPRLFSPRRHFALSFWKPLEILCCKRGELNAWILISGRQNAKGYDDMLMNPECNRVGYGIFLLDIPVFCLKLETQKCNATVSCAVLWLPTRNTPCNQFLEDKQWRYAVLAFVWPVCDCKQRILCLVLSCSTVCEIHGCILFA